MLRAPPAPSRWRPLRRSGHGFSGTGAAAESHFGLRLMMDAVTHGGGQLDLLSSPGAGTRIRIRYQAGAA